MQKPDFDLYVPTWLMVTLVVEVAIIGYINHNLTSWAAGTLDSTEVFAASRVSNLFFFMLFFFTAAPLGVYLFARLKLLDGNTKFLKLYSALGYSYVSYVPAIALTLIGLQFIKWLAISAALGNQLYGLYKQAD